MIENRSVRDEERVSHALPALILIVDDDPMICLLAEESLRQAGFRTRSVGTCQACMNVCSHVRPDAILLDTALPDGDGLELCIKLQRQFADYPVPVAIMSTVQDADKKIELAYEAGASEFITKPIQWMLLGQRMRYMMSIQLRLLIQQWQVEQQACLNRLMDIPFPELTMEDMLQQALAQVLTLSWPDLVQHAAIFLADESGQCLRLMAHVNLPPSLQTRCAKVAFGHCLCGKAASQKQTVFSPSVDAYHKVTCEGMTDQDHYHVPLLVNRHLLGLMVLYMKPGKHWHREQLSFLKTVGKILGSLIHLKRVEHRLNLTAWVFKDGREATAILDADMKILEVNQAFSDLTGMTAAEAKGQSLCVLQPSFEKGLSQPETSIAVCEQINHELVTRGHWIGTVWLSPKQGEAFLSWMQMTQAREGEKFHYVMAFADMAESTDPQRQTDVLHRLAFYDQLTGLCNRSLLMDRLTLAYRHSRREGAVLALMFFDLDRFKSINDTLGHEKGDELLREVARRIQGCVREDDTAARLGGDEFVVLLTGLNASPKLARRQVGQLAEKISSVLGKPFDLSGHEVILSASIGIAMGPMDSEDPQELIRLADLAMYGAKEQGGGGYCFFHQDMGKSHVRRLTLQAKLRCALERESLAVYLQPRLKVTDQSLIGLEALIRWWDEETENWISPREFIPVAEEAGLINGLENWVMEQICRYQQHWHERGFSRRLSQIAINVSPRQFQQRKFAERTLETLDRLNMTDRNCLELEITEDSMMRDPEGSLRKMTVLKEAGVRFAVDDFGTGYSNLACLERFPIDVLKIDQMFVRDCLNDSSPAAVIHTIMGLAERLDLEVVAEGVETSAQLTFLRQVNCHYYQGYFSAPALSLDEFEAFWRNLEGKG